MATSEPADEEDLPTFSLGLEFLTPEKTLKKRNKRTSKARVIVSRKTINFQTPISLSRRENTAFRNDKLKENSQGILDSFNSGNPIINGEEIVLRGQIVVLSSRRASGHLTQIII